MRVSEARQTAVSKYDAGRTLFDGLKRWSRLVERNLAGLGLTPAEFRVLRVLSESGPSSMVTLAMEQGMTAPGMTMVIDKLEGTGLVRRVRSDVDRRAINVVITGKGGEKLKRAVKLHDRFIERAIHNIPSQDIDAFLTTLNKIVAAAEDRTSAP